jgi:glycerol uptake facilitator-like aquaporin
MARPRTPTTPMQWIGLGMVIIVGNAFFPAEAHPAWKHYDALPDPIGWVVVVWGLFSLAKITGDVLDTAKWVGVLALLTSVPMWLPQLNHQLNASGEWGASMPQTVCCLLTARGIGMLGARQTSRDQYVAKRFGLLSWGFGIMIVLPVLALGGGVKALENPTVAVSALINIVFIWFCFSVHRRPYLGGPGPRLIEPATRSTKA